MTSLTFDSPDYLPQAPFGGAQLGGYVGQTILPGNNLGVGPLAVGAAGGIGIFTDQSTAQPFTVTVEFSNSRFGLPLNWPTWQYLRNTSVPGLVVLPPFAPWVTVSIQNNGGANWTGNLLVFALPGFNDAAAIMGPQVIAGGAPVSIGAGGSANVIPTVQIPGRATLWSQSGAAGNVTVGYWDGVAWRVLQQFSKVGIQNDTTDLILPMSDVRLTLNNTSGAAANFFYALTVGP